MAVWYRAFSFGAVNLGLIPSRVKPMTSKLVFTASLLDAQHLGNSVKNKPASLLAVPLGRAFIGIPPSWCGRQMAGNTQFFVVPVCSNKSLTVNIGISDKSVEQ